MKRPQMYVLEFSLISKKLTTLLLPILIPVFNRNF